MLARLPMCQNSAAALLAAVLCAAPSAASAQGYGDSQAPMLDGMFGAGAPAPAAPPAAAPAATPPSTFATPGLAAPQPEAAGSEEIATPASEPADASSAKRVTVAQPIASYDSRSGTWLPDRADRVSGWLPEIEVPSQLIDCTCNGQIPGPRCRVWRSFVKPTDPSLDPRCVVCVKEPYLDYQTVTEDLHVVIHRCFETSEPFNHKRCEGGQCLEAKGTTTLRKLHPCEAKVPVKYLKPIIRYRDVFYYIQCCDE